MYRWAQKKTGLRKATAVLEAEKAFHQRRALGSSFANDDKNYEVDGHTDRNSTRGHASLLVSAVESKYVERPRAPSVVAPSVLTLPRPLTNSPAAPPKWMKHPRSSRRRVCSHDSASLSPDHKFFSFPDQRDVSTGSNDALTSSLSARQKLKQKKKSSMHNLGITYETQVALNVLIGFPLSSQAQAKLQEASMPMDIELKELKPSTFVENSCVYTSSFFPARNPLFYRLRSSILPMDAQEELEIRSNSESLSKSSAQILNSLMSPFYSLNVVMHRIFGSTLSTLKRFLSGPADESFYEGKYVITMKIYSQGNPLTTLIL